MTQPQQRRTRWRVAAAAALTTLVVMLGLSVLNMGTASADPAPTAVSADNIDTSALSQPPGGQQRTGGNNGCGNNCVPIKWCDGKQVNGKTETNVILTNGDGKNKPECVKIPSVKFDTDDCCTNPPGGTIRIITDNPNKVWVPAQITIEHNGKSVTKNVWLKPGKNVVTLKKLPNGWYHIKVHLFDCIFGHKTIKVWCETKPTGSPTGSPTATPTATATATPTGSPTVGPTESESPAPGGGGGGQSGPTLPKTGFNVGLATGIGSVLVLLGGIALLLFRRRRTGFATE